MDTISQSHLALHAEALTSLADEDPSVLGDERIGYANRGAVLFDLQRINTLLLISSGDMPMPAAEQVAEPAPLTWEEALPVDPREVDDDPDATLDWIDLVETEGEDASCDGSDNPEGEEAMTG